MAEGSCLCGAVRFTVAGEPVAMGYCHCNSCRRWTGAPVYAFTMWPDQAVTVTDGANLLGTFLKTPDTVSHRQHCRRCGGAVMIRHPAFGMVDVPAGLVAGLAFVPESHANYAEHVLRTADGLPKFVGFPEEFGGSGETMPE